MIPLAPAWAERVRDAARPGEGLSRREATPRRHARPRAGWWLSGSGLSFSLTRPAPVAAPYGPRSPALSPPFEPPTRFRYQCDDPRGFFPVVTACRGPWLEAAASPAPSQAALAPPPPVPPRTPLFFRE